MKIKFCPKCKSKDIEVVKEGSLPGKPYHYSAPKKYRCKKCGYEGIFPEKS